MRTAILVCTIVSIVVSQSFAIDDEREDWGKKLKIKGGDLYYSSNITSREAKELGKYLEDNKFFDGNPKSTMLRKEGKTYQFRIVIKKGLETDDDIVKTMKAFAKELADKVFDESPIEIHLCDEKFRTLRVVLPAK